MTHRETFIKAALEMMGMPYLWDGKGFSGEPYRGRDCSGFVTSALMDAGGPDLRADWNTQRMFDQWAGPPSIRLPGLLPGDLCLYGRTVSADPSVPGSQPRIQVWHVMVYLGVGDLVFGAAGGDHTTTSLGEALKRGARVQLWASKDFMPGFVGYRRIPWLDSP